jgi:hypothetical protein
LGLRKKPEIPLSTTKEIEILGNQEPSEQQEITSSLPCGEPAIFCIKVFFSNTMLVILYNELLDCIATQ